MGVKGLEMGDVVFDRRGVLPEVGVERARALSQRGISVQMCSGSNGMRRRSRDRFTRSPAKIRISSSLPEFPKFDSNDIDEDEQEILDPVARAIHIFCPSVEEISVDIEEMLFNVFESIVQNNPPRLCVDGMGGTYMIYDSSRKPIAIFKPGDEEPMAPNNPKNLAGPKDGAAGLKRGIIPGEAMLREVAAYVLDHDRFARVPPTTLVHFPWGDRWRGGDFSNVKTGSLQMFCRSKCPCGDLSYNLFSVFDAQRIAQLDMRLMNLDRHDGNILVSETLSQRTGDPRYTLHPIDHGFCLPDTLEVYDFEWTWLEWPQVKGPVDPRVRQYVLDLNPQTEASYLKTLGIRDKCVQIFLITSLFLQTLIARCPRLSIYEIATRMCRVDVEEPSLLERLVARARWLALGDMIRSHPIAFKSQGEKHKVLRSVWKSFFWRRLRLLLHSLCRQIPR